MLSSIGIQFSTGNLLRKQIPRMSSREKLLGVVCGYSHTVSTGTHKTFLIFKGFEWGFGSALGLRAPGAILPAKNKEQSQIYG